MAKKKNKDLSKLISRLDKDRAWLLKQIDLGRWPEFRPDLASLERELGQLLNKASEEMEKNGDVN